MFHKDSDKHVSGAQDKKPVAPASTAKVPDAKANPANTKPGVNPAHKVETVKK